MGEPIRGPTDPPLQPEPATIVFCIERGRLEQEALVMLESLRRWGGALGQSRVLGVMPRRDRPLRKETIAALETFDVELHDASVENSMKWYNWYNKIVAVRLAERVATTPVVIWLDCDVLVLKPLHELGLPHGDDFAARRELASVAVLETGRERQVAYWRRTCEVVGLDWERVPWLAADDPWPRQKLLFNAGIFAFRRGVGFVEVYDDFTRRLTRAAVAYDGASFWFNEQNAVGLAMASLGLRFRELSRREHHMIFQYHPTPSAFSPSTPDARLIHYSRSRAPEYWGRFMARFEKEFPDHAEWLRSKGPIAPEARIPRDPIYLGRKLYRRLRTKLFQRRCVRASAAWERAGGTAAGTS